MARGCSSFAPGRVCHVRRPKRKARMNHCQIKAPLWVPSISQPKAGASLCLPKRSQQARPMPTFLNLCQNSMLGCCQRPFSCRSRLHRMLSNNSAHNAFRGRWALDPSLANRECVKLLPPVSKTRQRQGRAAPSMHACEGKADLQAGQRGACRGGLPASFPSCKFSGPPEAYCATGASPASSQHRQPVPLTLATASLLGTP